MDRETAARGAVDAGAVFVQVASDYGLGSPEAHGAQRAAEDALRVAEAAGCVRVDYDNARRQP